MASERINVQFEPFFGGFVLETLTIGMYGEARNAIREYIQNGFDSVQKAIYELNILPEGKGLIEVEMAENFNTLTIRDNGAGLPAKTAAEILTRIGASTKSHERNAGFRGIGRLAGIVFSDTLTFTTKYAGEREQTTVVFNARAMRLAMAPGHASAKSAVNLIKETVVAFQSSNQNTHEHFFEVKLEDFTDEPDECKSVLAMCNFVSQVAPVPYAENFPFRNKLHEAAREHNIPIEEVQITVRGGNNGALAVTKQYVSNYKLESGSTELDECIIYPSPTKRWWAWVGKKTESGAYTDSRVSGLRVRVRNIQIDETAIIRDIFRGLNTSHARFQDYFLGEVFVKPGVVVPNARRDGFEEDSHWKRLREELATVVKELGKEAYRVSRQGQLSVTALEKNVKSAKSELRKLKRAGFTDTDRVVALSKRVSTYMKRLAKAMLEADMETATQLQAINYGFADIKQETQLHMPGSASSVDREEVQQEARDAFLKEIMLELEKAMSPGCFAEAREVLEDNFGDH